LIEQINYLEVINNINYGQLFFSFSYLFADYMVTGVVLPSSQIIDNAITIGQFMGDQSTVNIFCFVLSNE